MAIRFIRTRWTVSYLGIGVFSWFGGCHSGNRTPGEIEGNQRGFVTTAADNRLANRCAVDPAGDLESRINVNPEYVLSYRSGADACSVRTPTTQNRMIHHQGIQRIFRGGFNFFVVTSSVRNATTGFEVVQLGSVGSTPLALGSNAAPGSLPLCEDRVVAYGVSPEDDRDHTGGIQVMGSTLIVPMEDSSYRQPGAFRLVDLEGPTTPVLGGLISRQDGDRWHAGGAALTRLADGLFLAMIFGWDADEAELFLSSDSTLALSTSEWTSVWQGAMPSTFQAYQNLQFITRCDGQLFLLGTYRNGATDNNADLWQFSLSLEGITANLSLTKTISVTLRCRSTHTEDETYCDFNAGAGAYVSAEGQVYAYGVEQYNDAVPGSDLGVKVREFAIDPPID